MTVGKSTDALSDSTGRGIASDMVWCGKVMVAVEGQCVGYGWAWLPEQKWGWSGLEEDLGGGDISLRRVGLAVGILPKTVQRSAESIVDIHRP